MFIFSNAYLIVVENVSLSLLVNAFSLYLLGEMMKATWSIISVIFTHLCSFIMKSKWLLSSSPLSLFTRSTIITFSLFLDAFQRIADLATNTKGATREIGTAFTRLILRHKSIEQKLKCFTSSLVETFIQPLTERIEDWKKSANSLDRDHAKGLKGTLVNVFFSSDWIHFHSRLQEITQRTEEKSGRNSETTEEMPSM